MNLRPIDRINSADAATFKANYLKLQKPVVIEQGAKNWAAFKKWNFEYMRNLAGEITVPLYDDRPVTHEDGFNEPHASMLFKDYVDLLQKEPTKYRIFLWNILKEVPVLQKDFNYPDYGVRFLKSLPMLFFGGRDSYTFMHYDIDLANIFHFHFQGEKNVILFDQKQTKHMYKVPYSLITREDIDFSNPDYEKWPNLQNANGFKTTLNHGDMLYMPEGYWHYMQYVTPGFSMSLRALPKNPKNLGHALYNILFMRYFDQLMRKARGQKWIDWKNKKAVAGG